MGESNVETLKTTIRLILLRFVMNESCERFTGLNLKWMLLLSRKLIIQLQVAGKVSLSTLCVLTRSANKY